MKALIFEKQNTLVWKDVPSPVLKQPYGAILKPILISTCSSDIHTITLSEPKQENHILGHECIAQITQTGDLVTDFKVGDIVAVPAITPNWREKAVQEGNDRHAKNNFSGHQLGRTSPGVFAEYFSIEDADTNLAHIPDNVSPEEALMCVDVMTTGFTGAEYANIHTGDTVCVFGIGPIGLMAIAAASCLGAARIIAVGSRSKSIELAKKYGATDIVNYKEYNVTKRILELTDNIGPDSVIIAGGNDEVFTQAIDVVKYGTGTISNVNYYGGTGSLLFPKFSGGRGMAGKTIHTELAKGGRARIERMMKMVQYGRVCVKPLITHRFTGLESIPEAIELMKNKPDDLVKIAINIK